MPCWRELHTGTHEFDWCNKGRDVALAMARGLNFLHKNNVVHRCSCCFAECDHAANMLTGGICGRPLCSARTCDPRA